jgi:5-oxoprolinase (ATP-hydrolysing)
MAGGSKGMKGVNLWVRKDSEDGTERTVSLGGKATTHMSAGDRIVVMTPGGDGDGPDPHAEQVKQVVGAFRI